MLKRMHLGQTGQNLWPGANQTQPYITGNPDDVFDIFRIFKVLKQIIIKLTDNTVDIPIQPDLHDKGHQ